MWRIQARSQKPPESRGLENVNLSKPMFCYLLLNGWELAKQTSELTLKNS